MKLFHPADVQAPNGNLSGLEEFTSKFCYNYQWFRFTFCGSDDII